MDDYDEMLKYEDMLEEFLCDDIALARLLYDIQHMNDGHLDDEDYNETV
jgi:hypothetical protein